MSFIWPAALLSLILLPVFILLYVRAQQRRRQLVTRDGTLGFMPVDSGRQPGFRRHVPPLIFLVGLALCLVALSRPEMVVRLPHIESTVLLAFDVSGSMAADDLKPSRMEAAKAAAQAFVQDQPSDALIGVIAFSDSGFAVQPPTNDREAILASINRLAPERGTSLANGIYAALNVLAMEAEKPDSQYSNLTPEPTPSPTPMPAGVHQSAAIVLLTDGENTVSPDPLEAAQEAARRGVRIYPVGVGSPAGASLEIEGFLIHTQLDEELLQQIAGLTGGEYYNAKSVQDLKAIYKNIDPQLILKPEKMEVTSVLAGLSILMLLIAGTFSLAWFRRFL
jgi:Ca-activated chloride channel homolog